MELTNFPIGTKVRIKFDDANGAYGVKKGDIGTAHSHPDIDERSRVWVAVKFDFKVRFVTGAYGYNFAIFTTNNLEPLWSDEDMFEDVNG